MANNAIGQMYDRQVDLVKNLEQSLSSWIVDSFLRVIFDQTYQLFLVLSESLSDYKLNQGQYSYRDAQQVG